MIEPSDIVEVLTYDDYLVLLDLVESHFSSQLVFFNLVIVALGLIVALLVYIIFAVGWGSR